MFILVYNYKGQYTIDLKYIINKPLTVSKDAIMKKLLAALIVASFTVTVSGCGFGLFNQEPTYTPAGVYK